MKAPGIGFLEKLSPLEGGGTYIYSGGLFQDAAMGGWHIESIIFSVREHIHTQHIENNSRDVQNSAKKGYGLYGQGVGLA